VKDWDGNALPDPGKNKYRQVVEERPKAEPHSVECRLAGRWEGWLKVELGCRLHGWRWSMAALHNFRLGVGRGLEDGGLGLSGAAGRGVTKKESHVLAGGSVSFRNLAAFTKHVVSHSTV
jgi:hypothetical protein